MKLAEIRATIEGRGDTGFEKYLLDELEKAMRLMDEGLTPRMECNSVILFDKVKAFLTTHGAVDIYWSNP